MGRKKTQIRGSASLEVLIGLGIACGAAAACFRLQASVEQRSLRACLETAVAGQVRFWTESFAAMPYDRLRAFAQRAGFVRDGVLYERAGTQMEWRLEVSFEVEDAGMSGERILVRPVLHWSEPGPGRAQAQEATLECSPLSRVRFP